LPNRYRTAWWFAEAVVLKNPWFAEAKLQRIGEEGEEESGGSIFNGFGGK
jgi:hypothetical protein